MRIVLKIIPKPVLLGIILLTIWDLWILCLLISTFEVDTPEQKVYNTEVSSGKE